MNDLTTRTLDETLEERAGLLPVPGAAAATLIDRAHRQRLRRTTLGTIGGVAAAAGVVMTAVLVAPSTTPERPVGPASSQTPSASSSAERSLSIDEVTRANAGHAWATGLPEGPPVSRDLAYRVWRQGDRVVFEVGGRQALLPVGVRSLWSPVRLADGWVFVASESVTDVPTRVIHVGDDLEVRVVTEATVVSQVVVGPGRRQFAVVSGDPAGDGGGHLSVAEFHSLDEPEVRRLELRGWQEPLIATWQGDVVTLPAPPEASTLLRSHDLRTGAWRDVEAPSAMGDVESARTIAPLPGAQGGDPATAIIGVETGDGQECVHLLRGSDLAVDPMMCSDDVGSLVARVGPGARYVVMGSALYERINADRPARVVDLRSMTPAPGVPDEVLAVGIRHLYWEDEHTLIGQATRVTPVHRGEALFRWDLETSSGQSLAWDLRQSPFAPFTIGSPDEPVVIPGS